MTVGSTGIPKIFRKRAWYSDHSAYAFLVDAPLSFGHSQLRIENVKSVSEEVAFAAAAAHIAKCIQILRVRLPDAVASWKALARYANTKGPYQKTLILKVSADETPLEYKVHLVPIFKSHLDSANRLYQATHNQPKGKSGGLLHWIGEREVIVDYDTRDRNDATTAKRLRTFRLEDLASFLRDGRRRRPR